MENDVIAIIRAAFAGRELTDADARLIADRITHATETWSDLAVPLDDLARAIAEHLASDVPVARALETIEIDDLYLARACCAPDAAALAAFEARCAAAIDRAIATSGALPAERADLGQVVRQRLLVPPAGKDVPRIASYGGKGALVSWVRVVATREAARMLPRERREPAAADDELAGLIASDDDPEIGYLKRLYRHEFKLAFQTAVAALDDRDRLLLRQNALDGLGIDHLAAQHGVGRSTIARWLEAARTALLAGTQRELITRLDLSRDELASLMRLIHSQLDVSLPRILAK
jgi:RNA polymerase sigma-70 factor (ECF subfamily)